MKTETLEYRHADGVISHGFLALPDGTERRPGVVIFHEAPGLDEHPKRRARMLAELGYVALAADLYGAGRVAGSGPEALSMMEALRSDEAKLLSRIRTSFDTLAAQEGVDPGRIGAMGYCFGGLCALELARSGAPVPAVVTFHGLLTTNHPAEPGKVKARIMVCTGAEDPLVPPEQVLAFEQEMSRAGVDWQIIVYSGAKHSFTNTASDQIPMPGFGYSPSADARSWNAMCAHFAEVFGTR
jgi:dienelactone hydrolase